MPLASIVELTSSLVRIPSRAGLDDCRPLFDHLAHWLDSRGVPHALLESGGEPVCLVIETDPGAEHAYLFNATVDTAHFGDESAWTNPPTEAAEKDGWLFGRGTADSKVAVALFAHLALELQRRGRGTKAGIVFAFDAGEHQGRPTGIECCLRSVRSRIVGGAIGYPGNERLLTGSRGFWRARLSVHGVAGHSGSSAPAEGNAAVRAAAIVSRLAAEDHRLACLGGWPLPPKLTVTGVHGGGDFSSVPDTCEVDVDARVTPAFDALAAERCVVACADEVDARTTGSKRTDLEVLGSWPAYEVSRDAEIVRVLVQSAEAVTGASLPTGLAGPSNIGNYLATRGISMTCGYGVEYRNLHAADEGISIASIDPVYRTYLRALERLSR